jgi:hypothetical protein
MTIRSWHHRPIQMIEIEVLALDLHTCTRCADALKNTQQAIALLQSPLAEMGINLSTHEIVIDSEAKALQHHFVSSPTIRINGADIAPKILESQCHDCTNLCGGDEPINCRIWRYQGVDYTEVPTGMIIDTIFRTLYQSPSQETVELIISTDISDNLKRFFQPTAKQAPACCSENELTSCCEATDKLACCGTETTAPATCGCL